MQFDGEPAQESYAHITRVLEALGDRHSFHQSQSKAASHRANVVATQPIESEVSERLGYLLPPGLHGSDPVAGRRISAEICTHFTRHGELSADGWIVDLRENRGGNMWPMMSGLLPLLGARPMGSFRDRDGNIEPWQPIANEACQVDRSDVPVAVLIGPSTASSGEAVAVAFKGRARTRFFGARTAGLSTANKGYPLPDGSLLVLTVATLLDRNGTEYPAGIEPDVRASSEAILSLAREWLRSEPR
jgi:hypothetical protein